MSERRARGHEDGWTAEFEAARPRLWGLAYRMLGSVADAEDAVQTTWLRWRGCDPGAIARPEAWLVTTCTRLCLDLRRSADRARVDYVGLWLPEPVVGPLGQPAPAPDEQAELASSLTVAFLHLLERLSPSERAAYLLREIFDYDYAALAAILERSEPACRQLVARARRALAREPEAAPRPERRREPLLDSFLEALHSGDPSRLEQQLAADVELWSDGGGKAPAASKVVRGRRAVARFLAGLWRRYWHTRVLQRATVNGAEGLLLREAEAVVGTLALAADRDGRWHRLDIQRNPDKLRHLQPRAAGAARA